MEHCSRCGVANQSGRFCRNCGAALATVDGASPAGTAGRAQASRTVFLEPPPEGYRPSPVVRAKKRLNCLVIMPFHGFDALYEVVRRAAHAGAGDHDISAFWLKDMKQPGRITDDIVNGLRDASFCISDLSGTNANVMWETGYAMALGKPTILIAREIEELPFDLRVHRVIPYSPEELDKFEQELAESVRQTLAFNDLKARSVSFDDTAHAGTRIAVTGSTRADAPKVLRRVESLLAKYLGSETHWYCGSWGVVDETVIDFLLAHQQKVTVVGYDVSDVSPPIRELIALGKVAFVDASVESLPRRLQGPSERDVLFSARADLVVLFWDGASAGTQTLLRFYEDNGNNLLLGFV